jgi:hypothetical protein
MGGMPVWDVRSAHNAPGGLGRLDGQTLARAMGIGYLKTHEGDMTDIWYFDFEAIRHDA